MANARALVDGRPDVCVTLRVLARPSPLLDAKSGWVKPGRFITPLGRCPPVSLGVLGYLLLPSDLSSPVHGGEWRRRRRQRSKRRREVECGMTWQAAAAAAGGVLLGGAATLLPALFRWMS